MEVSKINFSELLNLIKNSKLTIMGDWHEDQKWFNNQKTILDSLLDNNFNFFLALEYPREQMAMLSPFKRLIPPRDCLPLVLSYNFEGLDYERQISSFLDTYTKFFNPMIAIIGNLHLDNQANMISTPHIRIQQSFNGNTYPNLEEGIYQIKEDKSPLYVIKNSLRI